MAYPRYYAVNDRPVKVVQTADGGADILAFEWATGAFLPHREYWEDLSAHTKDVDQLSESQFDARVALLRAPVVDKLAHTPLRWSHTGDGEIPYSAAVDDHVFEIRINDFPAEAMYTLLAEGQEIADLESWPEAWVQPSTPQALVDAATKRKP